MTGGAEELRRLVEQAERSYTAMYDARRPKDDYEDACAVFTQAIALAQSLNLADEAKRLQERLENIQGVYNSQFRGF